MTRTLFLGFMWLTIGLAVALPVAFRGKRWLRLLSVAVLIWWAGVVWTGIVTNARVAYGIEHRDKGVVTDEFGRGARAARDASFKSAKLFCVVVAALSILAVVPSRVGQK